MKIPTVEEVVKPDIQSINQDGKQLDCGNSEEDFCVKIVSVADFPTVYGHFKIIGFINNRDCKDHTVIMKGDIGTGENILTRIHSECLTGDALGSLRCDCGPQLHTALEEIEREGCGILLYHRAEGRGIGLTNKLRAYALQDKGFDTYDANTALGFEPDERDYTIPAEMLRKLGVKSVRLMTNNPDKVSELEKHDIEVTKRVHHELPTHHHNERYLTTKKERFGHILGLDAGENEN